MRIRMPLIPFAEMGLVLCGFILFYSSVLFIFPQRDAYIQAELIGEVKIVGGNSAGVTVQNRYGARFVVQEWMEGHEVGEVWSLSDENGVYTFNKLVK